MDILADNGLTRFKKMLFGKSIFNMYKYLNNKLTSRIAFRDNNYSSILYLHNRNQYNLKSIKFTNNYQKKKEIPSSKYDLNSLNKISVFKMHKVDICSFSSLLNERIKKCINRVVYLTHKPKPRSRSSILTVPPSLTPSIPPSSDPNVVINNPENESSNRIAMKNGSNEDSYSHLIVPVEIKPNKSLITQFIY